jgi:uncharacterized membrane-anchored protein YitT (DUF2179 family)
VSEIVWTHFSVRRTLRDAALIVVGSLVYAIGIDCFEVPNGLAAGGFTGIATITYAIAGSQGVSLPVGVQTIAMNALLLLVVEMRTHNNKYVIRSVAGILLSGIFTDLLAPLAPNLSQGDLLLSALWGGVTVGVGIGIVFLSGGNTGGTDIVAQFISKRTGVPVGTISVCVDAVIVVASIPVFSLGNALYATVAMFITGKVIDAVVDGPRSERVAYIISEHHEEIANDVMYDLGRGCTELQARGTWSGNNRSLLFCVLDRSETTHLKDIVARRDPDAIVIISEVHEAFGEGFRRLSP